MKEDWEEDGFAAGFKTRKKPKIPKDYSVYLINDDVTPEIFVVDEIMVPIFHIDPTEAYRICKLITKNGSGLVGIYTKDIAYTKQKKVHETAAARGFPLKCTVKENK